MEINDFGDEFIRGSHNTMSYLPVRQWWLKPFRAWGRCQTKTLEQQWETGVRHFDFRIKFDKDGNASFGHGLITYECDSSPELVICMLALKADLVDECISIRILLENEATDGNIALFHAWLRDNRIVGTLMDTGATYRVGLKDGDVTQIANNPRETVVESCKQYDFWWHFILPPSAWKWEQDRIEKAIRGTGYRGIVRKDFV